MFVERDYSRYADYVPQKGDVVLDVGAHIGMYAIHAARKVGPSGLVVAVEPNPLAFRSLDSNVHLNRLANVKLVEKALGAQQGEVDIFTDKSGTSASSLFYNHVETLNIHHGEILRLSANMTTVDNLLRDRNLNRVDLVKIDAEGAETAILKGATASLSNGIIRRVVVEVHEDVSPKEETAEILRQNHFAIEHVLNYPDPYIGRALIYSCFSP